ncbi:hypothetical protein BHE74_00025579 [Ensete ventricosum]|nr:hypothetical protein BHE74_00025579 [Ensete ventricosum]
MDERRTYGKNKSGSFRKRTYDQFDNGKRKKHNSGRDHGSTTTKPIDTIYRILCPVKKIGSVLGKGGDIVNTLRDETHAKIRVADAIPGAEERVIIIFSYLSQSEKNDSDQDLDDSDGNEPEDMQAHCPAQDALLKIHDRIAADEILRGGVVQSKTEPDDVVTARILVPKNQVGCLLGKGGTIIQQLRSDTGANIRVLPSDHLPPCAMDSDELVQISGTRDVARDALAEIASRLRARTFRGGNAAVNPAPSAPFHGIPPLESRSDRGVPSYGNAALDYAPPSHFRGYTPPESFSAREIPTSSMVGPGKSVGYSYPKVGGRLKLHDPLFGAPERVDMHGSSDQLKVGHGPFPSYMTSGGQSFPPSQHAESFFSFGDPWWSQVIALPNSHIKLGPPPRHAQASPRSTFIGDANPTLSVDVTPLSSDKEQFVVVLFSQRSPQMHNGSYPPPFLQVLGPAAPSAPTYLACHGGHSTNGEAVMFLLHVFTFLSFLLTVLHLVSFLLTKLFSFLLQRAATTEEHIRDSHLIHRDEIEPVDDDSYSGIGDFAAGIFSREDGLLFFYNQRVVNDTLLVEQEKGSNQQQHLLEVDESFVAESWYGSPLDHHGEIGVDVPADDVAEPSDVAHPIIYDGTERDEDVHGDAYQNNENEALSSKKLRLEEDKEESLGGSLTGTNFSSRSSTEWRNVPLFRDSECLFSSSSQRSSSHWETYTTFRRLVHRLTTPKKEGVRDPYHELEAAYVAQICLAWEALNWNYINFRQRCATGDSERASCTACVAQQFQQFQVLLQRFIENEPCERGQRPEVFARTRISAPKLLQVPEFRGRNAKLMKIVSRILRMPEISQEQLRWCEKKMTKVRIWDGKVQRDSSPFPFPVH